MMRSWTGILCLASDQYSLRSLLQVISLPDKMASGWARVCCTITIAITIAITITLIELCVWAHFRDPWGSSCPRLDGTHFAIDTSQQWKVCHRRWSVFAITVSPLIDHLSLSRFQCFMCRECITWIYRYGVGIIHSLWHHWSSRWMCPSCFAWRFGDGHLSSQRHPQLIFRYTPGII